MENKSNSSKTMFLALILVSCFIFLITILVLVFALYPQGNVPAILQPVMDYHIQLMVIMALLGVSTGFIVYRVLSEKIERQQKVIVNNMNLIMKFLDEDEREILSLINQKGGMTTQSEISHLPGMNRLKAHRAVKKLGERGIIHVEKYGKVNMLRVVDELKGAI